jgi:hypothetical protein
MPYKDFSGNFHQATTPGVLTLSQAADFNDISALVQAPDRLQLVRTPRRSGNFALRMEVRDGDVSNGLTERAEVVPTGALGAPYAVGDEIWMATSVFIPRDMPNVSSWLLFHQIHGTETGSPNFALEYTGNEFHVTLRGGARVGNGNPVRENSYIINSGQPTKGHWHDFLCRIKWGVDNSGFVEVYYREVPTSGAVPAFPGTPQVTAAQTTGPNVLIIDGVTHYPKPPNMSIYRAHMVETLNITHGGFLLRRSRAHAEAFFTDWADLPAHILADNPRRYYRLNEASGSAADDLGTDNINATYTNTPSQGGTSLLRDGSGNSVNFTPANSWVNGGDLSLADTVPEWTYELLYQSTLTTNRGLIAEGSSASNTQQCFLYTFNGIRLLIKDDAGTTYTQPAASYPYYTDLSDGKPHHILVRFSKTTGLVEAFVDGEFEFQITGLSLGTMSLNTFAIGGWKATSGTPFNQAGDTSIQEVAVYASWLSDTRVQAHASAAMRDAVNNVQTAPVARARYLIKAS